VPALSWLGMLGLLGLPFIQVSLKPASGFLYRPSLSIVWRASSSHVSTLLRSFRIGELWVLFAFGDRPSATPTGPGSGDRASRGAGPFSFRDTPMFGFGRLGTTAFARWPRSTAPNQLLGSLRTTCGRRGEARSGECCGMGMNVRRGLRGGMGGGV
jgi:hypothetical protein